MISDYPFHHTTKISISRTSSDKGAMLRAQVELAYTDEFIDPTMFNTCCYCGARSQSIEFEIIPIQHKKVSVLYNCFCVGYAWQLESLKMEWDMLKEVYYNACDC